MIVVVVGVVVIGQIFDGVLLIVIFVMFGVLDDIVIRYIVELVKGLLDFVLDQVVVVQGDGSEWVVVVSELVVGDWVVVWLGDWIFVDGVVLLGVSDVD